MSQTRPLVMGIDAGGTMTDTILVDAEGNYAIGKAATTPANEADGFIESAKEAGDYWGVDLDDMFAHLAVVLYSGTGMLNTLLSRSGARVGLLITRGMEDAVLMGRGLQSWGDYAYPDRLHVVTHHHPEPLVPRERVHGVTERIDQFGRVVIPVYEREALAGARALIADGVEAICVCTLFSYVNPLHEQRIGELAGQAMMEAGRAVPVYLSHEIRPVIREQSRMNSVLIEAYATGRGRRQLEGIEQAAKQRGFRYGVQTMLSYGGLASVRHPRLHETMISGPIGGILGAKYIGDVIGVDSTVVSDMGGTSFDLGAITRGQVHIDNEPTLARFRLNLPTIALDSIGAGAGMVTKVDPLTGKVSLGPESAGSDPGPVCFDIGGPDPTICDCDAVLGRLNPNYFLGGKVKLNIDKASRVLRDRIADPLGVDVYEAAEGLIDMLDTEAHNSIRRIVSSAGVHPSEYTLMSYGGSGPLHLAGYSRGLGFGQVITFPFAAAFSAFGCTTADYVHRYSRSVQLELPADVDDDHKRMLGRRINEVWQHLNESALDEMTADGHAPEAIAVHPFLMMRYTGQLEDVEVMSPVARIEGPADVDRVVSAFENLYEKINRRVSRYSEAGTTIMELGLVATIAKVRPRLARRPLGTSRPTDAEKGRRAMYAGGCWHDACLYEMDGLRPGHEIVGPAIVEHPATTLVIPAGDRVWVDEWTILHYEHG